MCSYVTGTISIHYYKHVVLCSKPYGLSPKMKCMQYTWAWMHPFIFTACDILNTGLMVYHICTHIYLHLILYVTLYSDACCLHNYMQVLYSLFVMSGRGINSKYTKQIRRPISMWLYNNTHIRHTTFMIQIRIHNILQVDAKNRNVELDI